MRRFLLILLAIFVVVLVGGLLFLAFWDIPAPTAPVEKVIPDSRFQQ